VTNANYSSDANTLISRHLTQKIGISLHHYTHIKMSENIIRQGYDSNSNASTDLEARQTNTVSLEEEKNGAMFTTNCGFDCNDAAECDCFEQDEDSVDFVLQFDERYEDLNGKIAFCCQNCQ